jgi:Putative Actinobacterial Holin-X, holin superfamily III
MEKIFSQLQSLAEEVKEYVNVRISLVKLNVAETTSKIIANATAAVIAALIFLFFLFFASTGLALFLSSVIGNSYAGFLIVAGIYLVLGVVIWYSRGRLIQVPIMNAFIREMFDSNGKDGKN